MDINQIARMAGVSRATVSRYLNDGYVSQEKRAQIRRVIEQTGYVPSQHAKTLRTGKTNVVAVIIPKISFATTARMVSGLTPVLNEAGYQVILANTDNDPEREGKFLRMFSDASQADGVIVIGTVFAQEHVEELSRVRVPLVMLDRNVPGRSCVFMDNRAASRDITRLVLKESKRPVFIGVPEKMAALGMERRQGFLDACAEKGVRVPEWALMEGDFTVDSGYSRTEEVLAAHPEVDAIVCATDSTAYGALTCLREFGRSVPGDVQVTGSGDGELTQIVTPTLTTVHHHYKTSGAEAAKMLVGKMTSQDSVPREVKMSYEVVARNSTR